MKSNYPDQMVTLNDAQISIAGRPVLSFEVLGLPSVNTFYNKHHHAKAKITRDLREIGLIEGMKAVDWVDAPLVKRAFVLVKVWVPHEGIMDIHNVHIKPILDGLSDAGVWMDDEWAFIPVVMFMFAGIGTELLEMTRKKQKRRVRARRTIFEIYELNLVNICGVYQRLPRGRRRL